MKKLVINLFLFSFPFLLALFSIEVLIRIAPNDFTVKKEFLDIHSNDVETLILGSSHTFYGISPYFFESHCYNASQVSQTLGYDYEVLKKYRSRWSKLSTIIIPISYFSLFEKLEFSKESWRIKNYLIYYQMNDTSHKLKHHFEVTTIDFKKNIKKILKKHVKKESNITCSNLGWGTSFNSEFNKSLQLTGKINAERNTYKNLDLYNTNINTLEKIILFCKEKDVQIIFFTPPAHIVYRDNLNEFQLNKTLSSIVELTNKNENCLFINLLDDPSFIDEDFYDADHLNEIGAKKLSLIINNLVEN